MKRKTLIAICVFGFGTAFSQSLSTQIISNAGNYYSDNIISLTWTLGESIIETFSNSTNVITQGFNQTNLILTNIDTPDTESIINIFPNPAKDELNIQTLNISNNLYIELFELNGRLLISKELPQNNINKLNFCSYSEGIYLLKVYSKDNKIINNYKIQKTK